MWSFLPALSQASKTWRSVELKLNLPTVTAFNSIPRGVTFVVHYVGLRGRQLKVVLKYSIPQCQNSVFMQQSTVLEGHVTHSA